MKNKFWSVVLIGLISLSSHAQLVPPVAKPVRSVIDPSMVIQFGGQRLEVLPTLRAVIKDSNTYTVLNSTVSENFGKEKLGVAYSYATTSNILINGEVSIKLKAGFSISSLGALGSRFKVLVSPDIYVMTATNPQDLVSWVNLLQAQPAIQWVEPFTINARLN